MNYASPIIRIVCGLVVIVVAVSRYSSVRTQIAHADGAQIHVFGFTSSGEPWQLMLTFGLAGLVGIALIILGGLTLMKKIQEG